MRTRVKSLHRQYETITKAHCLSQTIKKWKT